MYARIFGHRPRVTTDEKLSSKNCVRIYVDFHRTDEVPEAFEPLRTSYFDKQHGGW